MTSFRTPSVSVHRRAALLVVMATATVGLTACSHAMMLAGAGPRKPAASEFGLGPRVSAQGRYVATLVPERAMRPRQLQTVRVTITDDRGAPIDGATLTIDGGMPQHGHGLPTKPEVSKENGAGQYRISGLKFSMGGWWELKLRIANSTSRDSVVFNIDL